MPYGSGRNFTRKSGRRGNERCLPKGNRAACTTNITCDGRPPCRVVQTQWFWYKILRARFWPSRRLGSDSGTAWGRPLFTPHWSNWPCRWIYKGWSNLRYGYRLQIGRSPCDGTRCILWTKTAAYDLSIGLRICLWQNAWWLRVTGGCGVFLCEKS